MTKLTLVLGAILLAALAACTETQPNDPITQAVAGRTLVAGETRVTVGKNGTLVGTLATGETLSGTWRISAGKWCRTLTQPARVAGPEACQDVALEDGQLTVIGSNGKPTAYTIE